MEIVVIVVFVLGYLCIALEHPLHVDKAASALITGIVCWAIYALSPELLAQSIPNGGEAGHGIEQNVLHHISEISSILFFLMGAMAIVETVDAHEGFKVITDRITTTNKVKLMWIVCTLTFFLSAVLDNLTTTIVLVSLLRKLIEDKQTRWFFVGLVVISANAGGAWSPIGDVTTTMLWIKKQLPDVGQMVSALILPSLVTMVAPLSILSFTMKGNVNRPALIPTDEHTLEATDRERAIIFALGIGGLLFVPVFKTTTHLPPFMGMMLSLGVIWVVTDIMHRHKDIPLRRKLTVVGVLRKIDTASVLFFLGILLAVAALQDIGILGEVALYLSETVGNIYAIDLIIGLLSAIVDNVPLVAAAQGMFEIEASGPFAASGDFWMFLAYCAGTGGSALIIGSAAGVAAMGLERIDFIWYLKKISWLAIIGYFAGAALFILMRA